MPGWPTSWDVRHAIYELPGAYTIHPMGRCLIADARLVDSCIAASIVYAAADIPDPRKAYAGPWTPGWSPL